VRFLLLYIKWLCLLDEPIYTANLTAIMNQIFINLNTMHNFKIEEPPRKYIFARRIDVTESKGYQVNIKFNVLTNRVDILRTKEIDRASIS